MPRIYTSDELLEDVKRRAQVPGTAADGSSDADILAVLSDELRIEIIPFLLDHDEEYLVVTEEQTIPPNGRIRVPARAIGIKLRELRHKDSATSSEVNVPLVDREDVDAYSGESGASYAPCGYYFEGSDIVFLPLGATFSGIACLSYFFEPGELVSSTSYRVVSSVAAATSTLTLTEAAPSSWTAGMKFDVHSPDSGAEIRVWSLQAASVSGTTVVLTGAVDGSNRGRHAVQAGDYLVPERSAAVPGIPRDLHPALAQAGARALLIAQGDNEGAMAAENLLTRMLERASQIFKTRNDGEPKTIVNRSSPFMAQGTWW